MARKYIFIVVLFSICFVAGCATAPSSRLVSDEVRITDLCRRYGVDWQWDNVNQTVTLSRGDLDAKILMGSRRVVMDGKRITLSGPVKRRSGIVYVPWDFKGKVMDCFGKMEPMATGKISMIVIDPGHGGKDPGAIGRSGVHEKTVVLDVAKRLQENLQRRGFKVTMTRHMDIFIPLEERARIANRSNADLFVSIHANASHSKWVDGFEIYYLKDLDRSIKSRLLEDKNYKVLFDALDMKKNDPVLEEILLDMLYTRKQAESKRIARHINGSTGFELGSKESGCRTADFSVLRNTVIPAVLVEVGYLSNKSEEKLLKTASYRQKIADSLTESILNYANK